jgi:hypothetical protein
MPIELSWMIPDKILLSRWTGDISAEDVRVLVEELGIALDTAAIPVHTVIDLSEARHLSTETARVYLHSRLPTHPCRGQIGIVRSTIEAENAADLGNRLSQHETVRTFATREEARSYLLSHDVPPPALRPDSDPSLSSSSSPHSGHS